MSDSVLRVPLRENPNVTIGDAFMGALTGSPDGDFLTDPRVTGVKALPSDNASGKFLQLINEFALPQDEKYPGPLPWARLKEIESAWEQLDFYRRVQSGQNPDPGLCRRCRRLCLIRGGAFTSNKFVRYKPFGTWFQLLFRTRCRICRLVVLSLSCGTFYLHPQLAAIDPEVQFTQLCPKTLPSGENFLEVEYGLRRVGVLRIVTRSNFREVLRQAYELEIDSPFELLRDDRSIFHNMAGQVASTELIKKWIGNCEQHHGPSCHNIWREIEPPQNGSIILIDVQNRRLVRRTITESRYFTLSYVWGTSAIPKTTKANFMRRQVRMSLPRQLPATIEDAMLLVRSLNEYYLWVDSLCIIQDNSETKHSDIQKMDSIYSHAVATIVALNGFNADAGLPGVRPGTRHPQRIECPQLHERIAGPEPNTIQRLDKLAEEDKEKHETYLSCRNIATALTEVTDMMRHMIDSDPNADLMPPETNPIHVSSGMVAHPPSLRHMLSMSPWNTRGWTLQERLLSRRCLYFSSEYIYFQCGEQTLSETGGNILTWADVQTAYGSPNAAEVSKAQETNPLLHFRKPSPVQTVSHETEDRSGVIVRQDFDIYTEVIEMYSKRNLSFATDIMHAITGILAVAHDRIGGQMIAGLPSRYVDLAMLWSPAEPLDRTTPVGHGGNIFPTWSWASWTGRKQYRLTECGRDSYHSLHQEYATSEIDHLSILHRGEFIEIYKAAESMRATEIRNLGRPPDRKYEKVFPKYIQYSERVLYDVSGPDFGPNVLQFWAYTADSNSFKFAGLDGTLITDPEHGNIPGKQVVTSLLDLRGKHCGLMFKPQVKTRYRGAFGNFLDYVLISSFGDTEERRGGVKTMDPELRPFDERAFPWKGKGSGLVNLMLIEWFDDVAERLAVAQIHRQAWEAARPVLKHIRLA